MDILKQLKQKHYIILLGIFLFSLLIRLYKLHILPFDFHEDELLSGYIGRYILENGKDIYGNPWPLLYFNKFGDYYIILPMYFAGLATYLFGVNEFAVRFPGALLGALVVFPVYGLTYLTFRNRIIGLLSAAVISIMPWHLVLSRSTVEGIMGSTIFLTGIVLFLISIIRKQIGILIVACLLFIISYFIYHPFRIYTPLVFALGLVIFLPQMIKRPKSFLAVYIIGTVIFFSLTLYISRTEWGKGRFIQTSIFSPLSGVDIRIQEQIYATGQGRVLEARMFHNKFIGYGREFITQYLGYFSPVFLFMKVGVVSKFDVPDQGLIYLSFFIFLAALFFPNKNDHVQPDRSLLLFLFGLLLLAPFPSSLTYYGSPNIHRAVFMSVILAIFVAWGIYKLYFVSFKKIPLLPFIVLFLIMETAYFWHQYSVQSDLHNSLVRNDGQRELVQYIQENKEKYDKVLVPLDGTMALYYLFYGKDFNPEYTQRFGLDARIPQVDNVYFVDKDCPAVIMSKEITQDSLIINKSTCNEEGLYERINTIQGKNPLIPYYLMVPKKLEDI